MRKKTVKISAVIITLNEEKNIARCIDSLHGVAEEIVVIDSFSTDKTKAICVLKKVRFIEHAFEGYVNQKNFAISQAKYDYILSLDADEVLSPQLKQSIITVKENWTDDGFKFNRLTNYCGKWIRHCGWYPDTKLRLWDRRKGRWKGDKIHETLKMDQDANVRHIYGDLWHYSYHTLSQHMAQIEKFTTIMAQENFDQRKRRFTIFHLVFAPPLFFLKRYFIKQGFRDGYMGFIICKNGAYYKYLKYAKLRKLYLNS